MIDLKHTASVGLMGDTPMNPWRRSEKLQRGEILQNDASSSYPGGSRHWDANQIETIRTTHGKGRDPKDRNVSWRKSTFTEMR
jgi:hypothetical protein